MVAPVAPPISAVTAVAPHGTARDRPARGGSAGPAGAARTARHPPRHRQDFRRRSLLPARSHPRRVQNGRVVARLQIDEKGKLTEVNIVTSEPPRVFDKVVRAAPDVEVQGRRRADAGEVEINFSLKD